MILAGDEILRTQQGADLGNPRWDDSESRVLAFTLRHVEPGEEDLHIMINMSQEDISMELPRLSDGNWHLAVDTAGSIKNDIIETSQQQIITAQTIQVSSNSIIVCESR